MANIRLTNAFELETRNKYTKVDCNLSMTVDGRELPTMAVLGAALEDAIALVQERISESYKVVPPRVNEPQGVVVKDSTAQVATPTPVPAIAPPVEVPTLGEQLAPVEEGAKLVELKPWQIGQ